MSYERGSGLTTDQLVEAMLKVKERQTIIYVCAGRVEHTVSLFRYILQQHNPSYAVATSPTIFSIPHKRAWIRFASTKSRVEQVRSLIGPLKIIIDHACMEVDPPGWRVWAMMQEEVQQWRE